MQKVRFVTKAPLWVYPLIFVPPFGLGLVLTVVAALVRQRSVRSPGWPVCGTCVKDQRLGRVLVTLMLVLWVPVTIVAFYGGVVPGVVALIGLPLGAMLASTRSAWRILLNTYVQRESESVRFAKPHPMFVQALEELAVGVRPPWQTTPSAFDAGIPGQAPDAWATSPGYGPWAPQVAAQPHSSSPWLAPVPQQSGWPAPVPQQPGPAQYPVAAPPGSGWAPAEPVPGHALPTQNPAHRPPGW